MRSAVTVSMSRSLPCEAALEAQRSPAPAKGERDDPFLFRKLDGLMFFAFLKFFPGR
jgi:hypothetical protein